MGSERKTEVGAERETGVGSVLRATEVRGGGGAERTEVSERNRGGGQTGTKVRGSERDRGGGQRERQR